MKKCFLFFLIFQFYFPCFALNKSEQNLQIEVPQILHIENIIVNEVPYQKNDFLDNVKIEVETKSSPSIIDMQLSPIKVQIRTNLITPISIDADFIQMDHLGDPFMLKNSDFEITPKQMIINNPYDHVISDVFIPFVHVKPYAESGIYEGILTFTLGAI